MSERLQGTRTANVEFHGLANGPEAVGRDETGKTVFAPFCAPGDFAKVQIQEDKASFARGFAVEWLRTARNLVKYAGDDGSYRDVESYLKKTKML